MKLAIDRAKWGTANLGGELLTSGGLMCCLGFLAEACGVPKGELLGVPMVVELDGPQTTLKVVEEHEILRKLLDPNHDGESSVIANRLAGFNDAILNEPQSIVNADGIGKTMTQIRDQEQREKLIKEGMAEIGVEVEFSGGLATSESLSRQRMEREGGL